MGFDPASITVPVLVMHVFVLNMAMSAVEWLARRVPLYGGNSAGRACAAVLMWERPFGSRKGRSVVSNPLVAQKQDSTNWHTGINLIDDAAACYDGVSSGSWVEGGIGAIGAGLDLLTVAMNPVGTLISYGLNWLIEHVKPLKDALDHLAGDADQIAAYSATWANVGKAVGDAAKNLGDAVGRDTANWTGSAADAYRQHAQNKTNALQTAATCANTISTAVKIVGVITGAVRGLVRDMVTQAIGDFIQDALEEVFSLGLGTPVVVAQVVEQVAQWTEKIGAVIKKLINSVEALRPLMSKLEELWGAVQKIMAALHGHVEEPHVPSGEGGGATHVSSVAEPHGAPEGTTSTSGAHTAEPAAPAHEPPTISDDAGTHTSSAHDGPATRSGGGDEPRIKDANAEPSANSKPESGTPKSGDPVDVSTGVMLQTQTDVELPGVLALVLSRTHKSSYRVGRLFGASWASTMDQRVEVENDGVHFAAADGMLLRYPHPAPGAPVMPAEGAPWPLAVDETGEYTITDGTGRTLRFASGGPVTAIVDRNGNRIDFDHDDNGVPTAVRHSGGYQIDVSSQDGLVTALHLRDGGSAIPLVRYGYDQRRRLVEVFNSAQLPMRFEYDDEGRMTLWEDRNGMWYRFHYDAAGRCVRGEGRDGFLSYTFDYDRENLVTRVTNSLGHTTTFHLNERLQVVSETDPTGGTTHSEWDRHHRLLAHTDALGNTTRYEYTDAGKLAVITRPDGSRSHAEYDEAGQPTVVVDPDGAVWRQEYDAAGNLVTVTDPAGSSTRYGYAPLGHLATVTDALGNTTRFVCDRAGLPTVLTDPTGASAQYRRDAFGRVVAITNPLGGVTRFTWSVEGNPLSRTAPDGATERWSYDAEGNLVAAIDALGQVSRTEIGAFDLPVAQIGPDGARISFGYDTELRLVAVTDPRGRVWRHDYDANGNLVREVDFDGRALRYERDAAGRLAARVNGLGEIVRLHRDVLGRVVEQRRADAATFFEYDPAGRLARAVGPDAELVYERDALGRVLVEAVNGRAVTSSYDALGRRVRRTTPAGATSTWDHDARDLPVSLQTGGRTVRFGYDVAGREIARELADGALLTQTWDASHRLRSQVVTRHGEQPSRGPSVLHRRAYGYRPDGRLVDLVDQFSGAHRFDLDPAGRVTAVHGADWSERYVYDPAGDITHAEWPGAHDAAGVREYSGGRIRRAGGVRYEHDAQGRIVLRQKKTLSSRPATWRYEWDADDRLTSVVTPDGAVWRYRYDPLGRRIAKQRVAGGVVVEQVDFAWDGDVLAEQATAGIATTWDWDGYRPIAQTERPVGQEWFDERFYALVTDLVGTPTAMVDAHGDVAWRGRTALWGAQVSQEGTATTPLRFPGQYFDAETQLNYNYHRYYDPETGRYASTDPLGLLPAPNPHTYVPNPHALIDPLGLGPYKIYRGMKNDNGAPHVAPGKRGLGADVHGNNPDVHPDENGMVHPGKGGLSTAPEDPAKLPSHRRPPEFGGTGKDPVWSIDPDKLPEGLRPVRDSANHVTIEPAHTMPLEEFQRLLAGTKGLWESVKP